MGLFDLFGKKEVSTTIPMYDVSLELHPLRLAAHHADYAELEVQLTNKFDKELLTSLVVVVPKGLGLDQSALSQQREMRFGMLGPQETKHVKLSIYATQRTQKALYHVRVYAIAHYRDYSYVMNEVLKKTTVRVE